MTIQIRGVDPEVRDRLQQLATNEGVSLNTFLVGLLERESRRASRAPALHALRDRGDLVNGQAVSLLRAARAERAGQLGVQ